MKEMDTLKKDERIPDVAQLRFGRVDEVAEGLYLRAFVIQIYEECPVLGHSRLSELVDEHPHERGLPAPADPRQDLDEI